MADLIWKAKEKNKKKKFRAPFVQTHNEYGPPWSKWFNRFKHILELDDKFKEILRDVRFVTNSPKTSKAFYAHLRFGPRTEPVS